ncbi:hypothetical protein DFR49_3266 [Hephaestia caeni]|uniref:Uncharacterized protein n=1 Tax=Hephaestia caeni TaxID=645617 RepID=A0A397NIM1_9SPHN|nr:hypothetical protein DFR49_3266 [Hephaestia caeni]
MGAIPTFAVDSPAETAMPEIDEQQNEDLNLTTQVEDGPEDPADEDAGEDIVETEDDDDADEGEAA